MVQSKNGGGKDAISAKKASADGGNTFFQQLSNFKKSLFDFSSNSKSQDNKKKAVINSAANSALKQGTGAVLVLDEDRVSGSKLVNQFEIEGKIQSKTTKNSSKMLNQHYQNMNRAGSPDHVFDRAIQYQSPSAYNR